MDEKEEIGKELTKYLVLSQQKHEELNKFTEPLVQRMNEGKLRN